MEAAFWTTSAETAIARLPSVDEGGFSGIAFAVAGSLGRDQRIAPWREEFKNSLFPFMYFKASLPQ
ncbi:MAG TPA: hypothetical protein VGY91_08280 [Chthoniobacterales bacterium]|nr:hypothetical protein [Chthoniobacterales bacterium]